MDWNLKSGTAKNRNGGWTNKVSFILLLSERIKYQGRRAETKFTTGSADNFHQPYLINSVATMTLKTGRDYQEVV